MKLDEACGLAAIIHSDDRFIVIAIGRFLLLEELMLPGAIERPWALTVMPRDMPTRRVTLRSPEQWTEYRELVLEELAIVVPSQAVPHTPDPAERPGKAVLPESAGPPVIKVTPTEDQFLLF